MDLEKILVGDFMADLIGRVEEMAEIKKCLNSDRSEFVVVYGHR